MTGRLSAYLFVLPLVAFTVFLILIPVLGTFQTSLFRDITFIGAKKFIGLENYYSLFRDGNFWGSVWFTILFTVFSVLVETVLGIFFALVLNQWPVSTRGFILAAVLLPWAIPVAISARIWELVYNYSYGLLNFLLLNTGLVERPLNWLATPLSATVSLVVADVWKTTPFVAIILFAGLQAIPTELYQAAEVDGAGPVQRFFRITLPLLKPVLVVAIIFRTIDALRVFDIIYIITKGGPGGMTESLSFYSYKFFLDGDFGLGSAASVVIFMIVLLFTLFYIRVGKFYQALR